MTPAFDRAAARLLAAMRDQMPRQPSMYFAACGRRRGFLSVSDMQAYEVGYWSHRDGAPMPAEHGPAYDGWMDRASEATERMVSDPALVRVRDLGTGVQSVRVL